MVWQTPRERAEDIKRRSARMLDLSMNSIRWERQTDLLEVFKSVGYAEEEKRPFWDLPGHGKKYDDCGEIKAKGCDHVKDHPNGKVFGRYYARNCRRKQCPVCFEGWAGAEAERALIRLASFVHDPKLIDQVILGFKRAMSKDPVPRALFHQALVADLEERLKARPRYRVVHFVLSPWLGIDVSTIVKFKAMKDKAYLIARESGISGGASVFHPYRLKCSSCGSAIPDYSKACPACGCTVFKWFWSPHFHVVGFGWLENTGLGYAQHGWVVKNLGVRKSVFATFQYLLSHAGVSSVGLHTVTWFGRLSYRALAHVPKVGSVLEICPYCGRPLRPLIWTHEDRGPPAVELSRVHPVLNDFDGESSDWRNI
jgi:hypothetical protein